MLRRILVCGILIYAAAAIDVGLPSWISLSTFPSCLTLLLVLFCQSLRGPELVAWAGMIGLYQDFLATRQPGLGVMTAATLALFAVWRSNQSLRTQNMFDRLISGMGMFLLLGLVQGGCIILSTPGVLSVGLEDLASTLLIRAAASYLLFVVVTCLLSVVTIFRRPSYHLENSHYPVRAEFRGT